MWSGDIDVDFRSLRMQIAAGLSMAMAGIPWWTTDIGGFYGGDQESKEYQELIQRWFEFSVFCPVIRMHGERIKGRIRAIHENKPDSGGPNEIWSYGEDAYEVMKEQLFLRERLRPYIYKLMEQAHLEGHPVMRPLLYDFPKDLQVWEIEDEYMFGPDLLIAPILYYKMRRRRVYFPEGCDWINAYTGEKISGGTETLIDAPIEYIPVFIRQEKYDYFSGIFV